ncbi:hypothetical protein GCM10018966_060720 [Streptomyces yanii]
MARLTVMPISAMRRTTPIPAYGPPSGRTASVPDVMLYGSQLVDTRTGLPSAKYSYDVRTQ